MISIATASEDNLDPQERFREYLATQGMRLTRERAIIVDEVLASQEVFDADQLVAKLSQRPEGHRVSRSTVFRTISQLVGAGLLRPEAGPRETERYKPI